MFTVARNHECRFLTESGSESTQNFTEVGDFLEFGSGCFGGDHPGKKLANREKKFVLAAVLLSPVGRTQERKKKQCPLRTAL